jgi:hypothetical protein
MSIKIGLISDTHSFLDTKVFQYFKDCDQIWHAGDFGSLEVAERLQKIAPLRGVYGNIDNKDIQIQFAENEIFTIVGLKIFMTHIGGKPTKYPSRVKAILEAEKPNIFICGHSHILMVQSDKEFENMLYINPGAAGNEGFHKIKTIMTFGIDDKKITNMKVIELGSRGETKEINTMKNHSY